MAQKVVCVDFDKTICDSNFPELGPIMPGAKAALDIIKALGYRIIISSCRSCGWNWEEYYPGQPFKLATERPIHQAMVDWLKVNDVPYDEIDDGTKGKVSADWYIDDKGIKFNNNWDAIAFAFHQLKAQPLMQQAYQAGQSAQNAQASAQGEATK